MVRERKHYIGDPKTILLCTDGSDFSAGAIRAAVNLARECRDTKLVVLRVIDFNPEFETEGQKYAEQAEFKVREHVELIREVAAEENVECTALVARSEKAPYKAIMEEAKKNKAELIIMGRRGLEGLRKVLMGSTTAKIVAYSECNVLIVPKDAVMNTEYILVATDGSKYSELAEREALAMSRSCHTILRRLIALSVAPGADKLPEAQEIVDRVKQHAREMHLPAEAIAVVGRPFEKILETASEMSVDIVVMGTHGRTGFEKIFLGSVAERVVGLAPCSVLIVKT